jgi:2-dehydropantoate 2-reductase
VTVVAVLGAGGVGGFVAAALARAGTDVVIVARESTAAQLNADGLRVASRVLGDFAVRVPAVAELTGNAGVLLVATKATGLGDALGRVGTAPGLVVPLLNGIDHLEVLRDRFGADRVAAGVIRIESDRPATGEIIQTSPGCRIDMASGRSELAPALRELAGLLALAGIEARIGDSERQVMWSKLARLCALALTTSAADRPIGFVRADPRWRSALAGAVNETIAVANADGADLAAADTLAELDAAHAELGSSMQRDIAAGRPTELDAIAGAVLRAAQRHRLRCPTVQWLAERVALKIGARLSGPEIR